MAAFERREVTSTRVEYRVPAVPHFGTGWAELVKAANAAIADAKARGVLVTDDTLWVVPEEEEVVVWFEVDHSATQSS